MPEKRHLQPGGLFDSTPYGYSQIVTSAPGTHVFFAGQVAMDEEGNVVGDDFKTQAWRALENLHIALMAVHASPAALTHLRIYIPNYTPELALEFAPILAEFLDGKKPPAQTLVGVQSLALPQLLIEIEATAIL